MMRLLAYIAVASMALVALVLSTVFLAMPRMNWSATSKPGALETRIARAVIDRWAALNANPQTNPLPPNAENLELGRKDFKEHCATCHGLDGSGRNQVEADFYPPVSRLTGETQKFSDAELYFVISQGIRLSGMPGFARSHKRDEIWRVVLWTRHLAHLTPDERNKIERETSEQWRSHEEVMRQGTAGHDFDETH